MRVFVWGIAIAVAGMTGCLAERTVEGVVSEEEQAPEANSQPDARVEDDQVASGQEEVEQPSDEVVEQDQEPELDPIEPGFPDVDFPEHEPCEPDDGLYEEICGDGKDNDCNGLTDDGCLACNSDDDCEAGGGGSFCHEGSLIRPGVPGTCRNGVCENVRQIIPCEHGCDTNESWGHCWDNFDFDGDGFTVATGDCDENTPLSNPDAPEICGDEQDNNCNGHVDDGCEQQPDPECLHSYDGQQFRHDDMCWPSTNAWCNEDGNVHISRDTGECRAGSCINEIEIEECDFGCEDGFCIEPLAAPEVACELDKDCQREIISCEDDPDMAIRMWEPNGCDEDRGLCVFNERVVFCDVPCADQENYWDCNSAFDWDDDSFSEDDGDCGPGDAWIRPEATEFCDLIDNDCDGDIDEAWGGLECVACENDAQCEQLECVFEGLEEGLLCGGYAQECWQGFCQRHWIAWEEAVCIEECGGPPEPEEEPVVYTRVGVGQRHACALRSDGQIVCWGSDVHGQSSVPEGRYIDMSVGGMSTCGVLEDGRALCWGVYFPHPSWPDPDKRYSHIDSRQGYNCGLEQDGGLSCWADRRELAFLEGRVWSAVSVGGRVACGINEAQTMCWANWDPPGQYVDDAARILNFPVPDNTFVDVEVGIDHVCGIREDGSVACWGDADPGVLAVPQEPFDMLASGIGYTCGITTDQRLLCWGDEFFWHEPDFPAEDRFEDVDVDSSYACAIRAGGHELVCWGEDHFEDGYLNPPAL